MRLTILTASFTSTGFSKAPGGLKAGRIEGRVKARFKGIFMPMTPEKHFIGTVLTIFAPLIFIFIVKNFAF